MKVLNSISSLGVTLEDLYNAKDKQVKICLSDKEYAFNLILNACGNQPPTEKDVDCKISSFGANIYFRTEAGMKYKRYKSLAILQREVVKKIKHVIDTNGDISFTLSNEVYTI